MVHASPEGSRQICSKSMNRGMAPLCFGAIRDLKVGLDYVGQSGILPEVDCTVILLQSAFPPVALAAPQGIESSENGMVCAQLTGTSVTSRESLVDPADICMPNPRALAYTCMLENDICGQ